MGMRPGVRAHPQDLSKLPCRFGHLSVVKLSQPEILSRFHILRAQTAGFPKLRRRSGKILFGVQSRGEVEMGVRLIRRGLDGRLELNYGLIELLLSRQQCA